MPGLLREYSDKEMRPPRPIGRYLLGLLGVVIVAGGVYWYFRDVGEIAQLNDFIAELQAKNYPAAYARWGCTVKSPCKEYPYETFLRDWGPESPAAKPDQIHLTEKRSCSGGVIQTVEFAGEKTLLYINRKDKSIGFSPWPVCRPRMAVNGG
jgi:hypothetical protein